MTQTATEPTIKQGSVLTLRGGMWKAGMATLSSERFYRQTRGYAVFNNTLGLLGAAINQLFPLRTDVDIPLTSITAIGRGKMGLLKDVLYIGTADGKSYTFRTDEYQLWVAALTEALQTYRKATVVQSGDERWSVQ